MRNVFIFLADGFEEIEALAVVDILRRANINVRMISISKDYLVKGSHDILVKADAVFDETNFDDSAMFILPGGMPGTANLRKCGFLKELIKEKHERGILLGAICAAPTVLMDCGLLDGKTVSCHFSVSEEISSKAKIGLKDVETEGNIITSKGAGCSLEFGLTLASMLVGGEAVNKIKKTMCIL